MVLVMMEVRATMPDDLTPSQRERYARNLPLSGFGEEGQRRLLSSRALVVGAGGLGCAVLPYLAAAGVGHIRLADGDVLEASNLNRQVLHSVKSLGSSKAQSAAARLAGINPDCRVEIVEERVGERNLPPLLKDCDAVLDCSDNFPTRFAIADAAWRASVPLVTAAVSGWAGQLMVQCPRRKTPCYRCLLPEPPPDGAVPEPSATGVLGAAAGTMGTMQATEAIKLLLDEGELLTEHLLAYDAQRNRMQRLARVRRDGCALCGG